MTSLRALLRQNPNYRYAALGLPIHHFATYAASWQSSGVCGRNRLV